MRRRPGLLPTLLALTAVGGGGDVAAEPAPARIRALLVGVAHCPLLEQALGTERYRREVALVGPPHDVALLRDVLVGRLGATPEDVTTLVDPTDPVRAPTRRTILRGLARLGREANAGDTVFVLLAGHGTQVLDLDGDEPDGLDEVFLAADARPRRPEDVGVPGGILDDELGAALDVVLARGARAVLVVDACHAGTMARGASGAMRTRWLEPGALNLPPPARRPGVAVDPRLVDAARPGLTAVYAAGPDEKAAETRLPLGAADARPHGLLSWALAQELARSSGRSTWRKVGARLVASVVALGVHGARPRVEGDLDVALLPSDGPLAADAAAWLEGDSVAVDAGSLDGLCTGDVLDVRPAADARPGARPLARGTEAVVVSVGPLRAHAALGSPADRHALRSIAANDATPLRARVVARAGRDVTLPLAVVDGEGRPLPRSLLDPAVRAALEDELLRSTFPPTDDPREAAWHLVVYGSGSVLRSARWLAGHDAPRIADGRGLKSALAHVARFERLVRLAGERRMPPPPGLVVEGVRDGRPLTDGERTRPGDRLSFRARNDGGSAVDVWAFLLDAALGVTCVFPDAARSPRLAPGASATLVEGAVTDETLGAEHLLVVATPAVADALPADFRWLESPPLQHTASTASRGGKGGDLRDALTAAAFGGPPPTVPRGGGAGDGGLLLRSWTTAWEPLAALRPDQVRAGATATLGGGATDDRSPLDPVGPGRASLARSPLATRGPDLLVHQSNDTTTVVLLAPGVARDDTADEVRRLVAERRLPAAIALSHSATGRSVFYDRDGDGVFDLRLDDVEGDAGADLRVELGADGTIVRARTDQPWLRLSYLDASRHRPETMAHTLALLRALLIP